MVNSRVTGARYGIAGWLVQRVSAAVMLAYTGLIAVMFLMGPGIDASAWHAAFAAPWLRLASVLFLLSLLLHTWIGLRDVLMDYVHPTRVRLPLQVLVALSLIAYALWGLRLLWGGV